MNFISTLIFFNLCWFLVKCSSACSSGWFGSKCQLKCHCASGCDIITGQCLNRFRCAPGWFGVACQYLDLTRVSATNITDSKKSTNSWITDGNDSTCNADINLHAVTVTWNQTFPFTWLRLTLNDINNLESVVVKFKTNRTEVADMSCEEQRIFLIDTKTADIRCHVMLDVMQVTIAGRGVNSLCSLYINGGRNVALKQGAVQSSTYTGDGPGASLASNAVDGNTDGHVTSLTCTNTDTGDPSPHWTVTFGHPQLVNRFVLYNRIGQECGGLCRERLKSFTLESFDSKNTTVFRYQDSSVTTLTEYTVTVPGRLRDAPVSALQIKATVVANKDSTPVLTLCEFEAYGDCVPGTWGLDCNNTCDKSCNTTCHEETGACQVCIGFSNPPTCDISCRIGQWGMNCLKSCSTKCLDTSCDKATGICDRGCHGYDDPPACNKECSPGFWGANCTSHCNNCLNTSCDHTDGKCNIGCGVGISNFPYCNATCPKGFHGVSCSEPCSRVCKEGDCDSVTGDCLHCNPGYLGPHCAQACGHRYYGQDCSLTCSQNCKVNESLLPEVCHHVTGTCLLGCLSGYSGILCLPESSNSTTAIGIAFGLTVGGLLTIILVLTICLWRRRGRVPSRAALQQSDHDRAINYDNVMPSGEDDHEYERVGNSKQHQQKTRTAKVDKKTTTPADHRPDNDYEVDNVNRSNFDFQNEAPIQKRQNIKSDTSNQEGHLNSNIDGKHNTIFKKSPVDNVYEN